MTAPIFQGTAKLKILVFLTIFIMGNFTQANEPKIDVSEAFGLLIPEIKFDNTTLEDAAAMTLLAFRKAHPADQGIKGIIVSAPKKADVRITLILRNVPVGIAFEHIAASGLCVVSIRDGIVTLAPSALGVNSPEVFAVQPSKRLAIALKLNKAPDSEKLRSTLMHMGINPLAFEIAEFKSSQNLLFFKAVDREIDILRSVIELIERGVAIEKKTK